MRLYAFDCRWCWGSWWCRWPWGADSRWSAMGERWANTIFCLRTPQHCLTMPFLMLVILFKCFFVWFTVYGFSIKQHGPLLRQVANMYPTAIFSKISYKIDQIWLCSGCTPATSVASVAPPARRGDRAAALKNRADISVKTVKNLSGDALSNKLTPFSVFLSREPIAAQASSVSDFWLVSLSSKKIRDNRKQFVHNSFTFLFQKTFGLLRLNLRSAIHMSLRNVRLSPCTTPCMTIPLAGIRIWEKWTRSMPHEGKTRQAQECGFVFCWQSPGWGIMHAVIYFWTIGPFSSNTVNI